MSYDGRVILVVEDDEDVRDMLEIMLAGRGFETEVARDGPTALLLLERLRPCLVILDLVMPVMSGWQVLDAMSARGLGDIPVCVASALERKPATAVDSLSKPFVAAAVIEVAARYCSHRVERVQPGR